MRGFLYFRGIGLAVAAIGALVVSPVFADEGDEDRDDILVFEDNTSIKVGTETYTDTFKSFSYDYTTFGSWTRVRHYSTFYTYHTTTDGFYTRDTYTWSGEPYTEMFFTNARYGFSDTDTETSVETNRVFFDLNSQFNVSGTFVKKTPGGATVLVRYDSTSPTKTTRKENKATLKQDNFARLFVRIYDANGGLLDQGGWVNARECSIKAKVKESDASQAQSPEGEGEGEGEGEAGTAATGLTGSKVTFKCDTRELLGLDLSSAALAVLEACLDGSDTLKIQNKTDNFRLFKEGELEGEIHL